MATVVETVERDGNVINIYDSGMERNMTTGKIIRPPTAALITKASSGEMVKKRQEKAARLLRERIKDATGKVSILPINDGAEAIAEAGGILWEEIVLNADAYHRDRLEAFEKLGRVSELLPNVSQRGDTEKTNGAQIAAMNVAAAQAIERVWRDVMQLHEQQQPVIEGLVSESDISATNNTPDTAHRFTHTDAPSEPHADSGAQDAGEENGV